MTRVTNATLQRWAAILVGKTQPPFHLEPISVEAHDVLFWSYTRLGGPIGPCSQDPLPAGDYGWFEEGGEIGSQTLRCCSG